MMIAISLSNDSQDLDKVVKTLERRGHLMLQPLQWVQRHKLDRIL